MTDKIDKVADKRILTLKDIKKWKLLVAKGYKKKVRLKNFQVGDIVWRVILPVGLRSQKFDKWSPSWKGPL